MRYYYTENGQLKERPRRIILAFKGRLRSTGARFMRCDQLAGFGQRFCSDTHEVTAQVLPHPERRPKQWARFVKSAEGAAVVALKGSLDILSDAEREELRQAASCLAIDHVDAFAGGEVFTQADLHIAASEASRVFMYDKCERIARHEGFDIPPIAVVDHHADERITAAPQPETGAFRLAYIGDRRNTVIPEALDGLMLEFSAQAQEDFEQILTEIPKAHMHYCVRPAIQRRQPKPFTKGFTAALADRNLICTPAVPDAIRFLGADYPFMAAGEEAHDIIEAVEIAQDALGSPDWDDGLERIRTMREAVRPQAVARQLIAALDGFF